MGPEDCRLQLLVTARDCAGPPAIWVREAIRGGVDLVQIREKDCTTEERMTRARPILEVAASAGVPVLVNDDVEAALQLGVAGVHLGQTDTAVDEASRRLGSGWIGLSTHSRTEMLAAHRDAVTHVGLGACFETQTRAGSAILEPDELTAALQVASLPVFAIGGIDVENVHHLRERGVTRIAVSSCILRAADPRGVAARLREALL